MPQVVQPRLRDPLRTYNFHISIVMPDGPVKPVGGVQRVSGLSASVTSYDVWEGGNNLHRYANPDKINWDPVTLEQGLALDRTLDEWAAAVRTFCTTGKTAKDAQQRDIPIKRDVVIEVFDDVIDNETGLLAFSEARGRKYLVRNAWVSKFTAVPKLDATAIEVGIVLCELIHEGWVEQPFDPAAVSNDLFNTPQ